MDGVKVSFLGDSRDGPCRGGWGTVGRRTAGRDAGGGATVNGMHAERGSPRGLESKGCMVMRGR